MPEVADADLITLSACDTAMPARRDTSVATERGASSSLVSFAFAGNARFVLSSLWTASDELTADAMVRFYTALQNGRSEIEALYETKKVLIETNVHPHYFAIFCSPPATRGPPPRRWSTASSELLMPAGMPGRLTFLRENVRPVESGLSPPRARDAV